MPEDRCLWWFVFVFRRLSNGFGVLPFLFFKALWSADDSINGNEEAIWRAEIEFPKCCSGSYAIGTVPLYNTDTHEEFELRILSILIMGGFSPDQIAQAIDEFFRSTAEFVKDRLPHSTNTWIH